MITKIYDPVISFTDFNRIPIRSDKGVLSMQFGYNFLHTDHNFEFTIVNDFVAYAGRKGEVILQGCSSKFVCETDGKITPADLYKLHVTAITHLKNQLQSIGELNAVFAKKIYPPDIAIVKIQLQRFVDVFMREPDDIIL